VVSGPPASGKTTLARRLAGDLGWPLLAKDDFKESLFDALGTGDAAWSRRLSEAAVAAQLAAARALVLAGQAVVVEGNFRPERHGPVLGSIARAAGALLLQVACEAAPAELDARLAARATTGGRHPGHRAGEAAAGDRECYRPLPGVPTWSWRSDGPDLDGAGYAGLTAARTAAVSAPASDTAR